MISPVIATSSRTVWFFSAETIAVAIVTPADGPSFGIAPAGTWTWRSCLSRNSASTPSSFACGADVAQRGARRLLHHVAELPGEDQVVVPGRQQARFDEQHVAAGFGPRHAGGDAGPRDAERHLLLESRRPEVLRHVVGVARRWVGGAVAGAGDARGDLPRDRADLPLEVPHARLRACSRSMIRRIAASSNVTCSGVSPCSSSWRGTRYRLRDVQLLLLAVAGERDDFHPVEQRRMNRAELVRRRDEQHAATGRC